ncbi:MAG: M55 family metallopeptidase [Candidatus Marinimicrobia bacterium]|nr:M55 family metallopeptidase [Candidatus Neomarinimicrobiota bacterium]MBL7010204.1 M55 family metallopeptidase [Candidatus Neomarinimicrobiota bacterium]MBL7030617.1 M55 family metallopeptidase [Candidatus Neomarinimicrobiota bacterium]
MNRILKVLLLTIIVSTLWGKGKKIYISADLEGVVGAVTGEQLGPSGFEYNRFREFMTAEVNAAIRAAKSAGATEILVADSHGNGQNLLIEKLPKDVQVIRSWPRPLGMMEGIDSSFDGVIFTGYHASTDNLEGVRAHTFSSAKLTSVKVNGQVMTEGSWNAAIAGHFGVPVILVAGDDAAVKEVKDLIGNAEGAIVKESISFHSAKTLHPEAAYDLIAKKTAYAVKNIKKYIPYKIPGPITVSIRFKHYQPSQVLAYLDMFKRTSSHTIEYNAKDMIEASHIMRVVTGYNGGKTSP